MQTVGQIVRHRREQLGLTLGRLAACSGLTKGYLSMIENHRVANPPSRRVLTQLEQALELADGELRRAAGWQAAPPEVRQELERLADDAERGRELAEWLRASTSRRAGGGKNLDKLYRSGVLRKRVAKAFGEGEGETGAEGPRPSGPMRGRVPLINKVTAGYPRDFTDLDYPARVADEYVSSPATDDPDAFAATVCGDSMLPEYREGDIVVFSSIADVTSGCDCFVRLEPDHETTFKRVFFDQEAQTIRLQPLNPKFAPMILPCDRVAGLYRAVWRMSKL